MKKVKTKTEDLKQEYDLRSLTVRKLGPERKNIGAAVVRLEPDVAEVFTNADAVNEALRFLIKIAKRDKSNLPA
jgi:hypothetical protein